MGLQGHAAFEKAGRLGTRTRVEGFCKPAAFSLMIQILGGFEEVPVLPDR